MPIINFSDSPRCVCGHRLYDHPTGRSCCEPSKRCSCGQFKTADEAVKP